VNWERRSPPGELLDIAIDPGDSRSIVASGDRGLLVSRDAGASWRPLSTRVAGMLAWTDTLTVVDPNGTVLSASGQLGQLQAIGRIDGQPAALAVPNDQLLLARHENRVLTSDVGGRTWADRLAG
jgi:hypothetical protein